MKKLLFITILMYSIVLSSSEVSRSLTIELTPLAVSSDKVLLATKKYKKSENTCKKTKQEVESVVKELFSLFRAKDIETINRRFIHPKYGFYHFYRPGVMDVASHYMKLEKIPSKTWTKENTLFRASQIKEALKWESVETYCGNPTWTKEGIFVHQKPYLSAFGIWKDWEDSYEMKPSKNEKKIARFLEKNLFVVVDTASDIVIYLKKIEGKWYLTHIDRAASDCSA